MSVAVPHLMIVATLFLVWAVLDSWFNWSGLSF